MKNGSRVWYCKRTSEDGAEFETFAKPVEYVLRFGFLTIQPMSGYNNVIEFGESVGRTWNAIGQPYDYWFNRIQEGDRFYVDGAEPNIPDDEQEPEDGWGYDANAKVTSVRPQNIAVRFILTRVK